MPIAPKRFTIGPPRKAWAGNNATKRKVTGRALQHERERLFKSEPMCRMCRQAGRVRLATIRDHIVALAFGGKDERSNTQGLCNECHDAKSKQESIEGRRTAKGEA